MRIVCNMRTHAVHVYRRSQESRTIRYQLDEARMHAIFIESPTVHRAFRELVPDKVHCYINPQASERITDAAH
jgi:hypothetical protein